MHSSEAAVFSHQSALLYTGGRDTPILGHPRDVRPEWVSFRGQNSADGCKFPPNYLPMGHDFNT